MDQNPTVDLTTRELRLSYWYITHKLLLERLLTITLTVVAFAVWFYVIWQLAFFGVYYREEQAQVNRLVFGDNLSLAAIEATRPQPLQLSAPVALPGEDGRTDYLAPVANPNQDWLATFDYKLTLAGGEATSETARPGFVLPTEQKHLLALGQEGEVTGLELTDLKWRRLAQPAEIYAARQRFTVTGDRFVAGDPSQLAFELTNNSPYSYWEVGVQTFLYSGGQITAVNYLLLEQLKSGETRPVELNWTSRLPRIDHWLIVPEINVFDDDNIMPPLAEPEVPVF